MPAAIFVGFLIAGLVAIVIAVTYWSPDARIRRELRNARLYRIADLGDGMRGRIVGHTYALMEPLLSPLTSRPCVHFTAIVEERIQHGKTHSWRTIITETRSTVFGVRDDSGRAIIDPSSAQMSLDFDGNSKSGTFDNPTPAEEAFLARHHTSGKGWVFNKALRYREAIIGIDESVAILGSGVREPDPDAPPAEAYRGEAPTRLRLTSSPSYPLVISDKHDTKRLS